MVVLFNPTGHGDRLGVRWRGSVEVGAPGPVLFCTLDACGYQVALVGCVVVSGESAERRLAGYHDRNGIGRIAAFPGF